MTLRRRLADAPAPALVVGAALSVQLGAALATSAFDAVRPLAFVWLRVGLAALLLLALNARTLGRSGTPPLRLVLGAGAVVALMNACFYEAIDRIPLGLAVTIEFLGPLAVAVAGSRRALDFVWVALAGAGVALLGSPGVELDPAGLAFALGAAAGWAGYIVLGKRLLRDWSVGTGLSLTLAVAALLLAPAALAAGGRDLLDGGVLATGLAVAVLGSVIPFTLELAALRRLSLAAFGILLSLEPAVAALVGALALAQVPGALEALAVLCVTVASAGASAGARRRGRPLPPPEM
ncbi:MAG TPA: EamA family transporter [Gaiellaceae bacterium]|nr:EamA family transporter [Gaiellaceae bacterium]